MVIGIWGWISPYLREYTSIKQPYLPYIPLFLQEITKQNPGSEITEGRALMTSNIAYAHLVGKIPFIAHDGCKDPDFLGLGWKVRIRMLSGTDETKKT